MAEDQLDAADEKKWLLAEREGFEPSVELSPHTHLAGERLKPTRPSLRNPVEAGHYLLLASSL